MLEVRVQEDHAILNLAMWFGFYQCIVAWILKPVKALRAIETKNLSLLNRNQVYLHNLLWCMQLCTSFSTTHTCNIMGVATLRLLESGSGKEEEFPSS